jgi:hypothetical protein
MGLVAAIAAGCSASDGERSTAAPSPLESFVPSTLSEVPDFESAALPPEPSRGDPAGDPVDAVRRYLAAAASGDAEGSYAVLSAASRESAGSVADWAETASQRPTVIDFELDATASIAPDGVQAVIVPGDVTLEPRLDEVSGFVPARAEVEWKVVAEDGGWKVDIDGSTLTPVLPDETGASAAAELWAATRQQCGVAGEYDGSLLGSPVLGERLCGLEGELVAGPAAPLDESMTAQVVAAFGPDALGWARSVELSGAAQLSVVTAPLGDHWVVVGVGS